MDRRRAHHQYPVNARDNNDEDFESDDDTSKKSKYSIPLSTWAGIWMSAALLLTFIVVVATRMDIIHIALSRESSFHANHISENHIDLVLNRVPIDPVVKAVEANSNIIPTIDAVPVKTLRREENKESTTASEVQSAVIVNNDSNLESKVKQQIELVRKLKFVDHIVMEQDETAKREIAVLQDLLRKFVPMKYGPEPYVVEMTLHFPDSMHEDNRPDEEVISFELGPLRLVPYSTYKFLEIMDSFKGGAFHRRAGHVLQAMVNSAASHMAFQEYHPKFPHVRHTLGYAGRPGGPAFYISTVDNTDNHGPASQGSKTEADGCFGKIVSGFDVVKRMQKQPGGAKGSGFISDSSNFIRIKSLALKK